MPWIKMSLRNSFVWTRCDAAGAPSGTSDGRVDILYQPGGKVYRAALRNLTAAPDAAILGDEEARPGPAAQEAPKGGAAASRSSTPAGLPSDAVHVYTDGACTGNPGPMGIGVVILDPSADQARQEISEYLGSGTNNIAELTAILRGLEHVPRDRTVVVYSDSAYALGLLGKGWKAKANQTLVAHLRRVTVEFRDLRLVKVAGHAGVPENERCDELAREAVVRRAPLRPGAHPLSQD